MRLPLGSSCSLDARNWYLMHPLITLQLHSSFSTNICNGMEFCVRDIKLRIERARNLSWIEIKKCTQAGRHKGIYTNIRGGKESNQWYWLKTAMIKKSKHHTYLAASAKRYFSAFRCHSVSNSAPAQKLFLKLCKHPIVMRPESRFGL